MATCSPSHEVPASSNVPGQHSGRLARFTTTPEPFLQFPMVQNRPLLKEIITSRPRGILAHKNRGDIEQAVNCFGNPVPAGRNSSNNSDESQRVRDALACLQAFTNQFEGEFQRLCVLAQSGQLSAEDRLRLEEIRSTTGLTIPHGPRHDRSNAGRASSDSSSSSIPPSYCTR
jgi:hypothetical protein